MTAETEKFSQFAERLIQLAYSILADANIAVDEKGLANPKILATTLLIRNISNFKAIVTLIQADQILESRILLRCCYENLLWVGRLSTDGQKFVKEMQDNEVRTMKALGEYVMGQVPYIACETKEKLLDNLKKIKTYGDNLKLLHVNNVAKNNVVGISYLAYSQLSAEAAHPSLTALTRYLFYSEENGLKYANARHYAPASPAGG